MFSKPRRNARFFLLRIKNVSLNLLKQNSFSTFTELNIFKDINPTKNEFCDKSGWVFLYPILTFCTSIITLGGILLNQQESTWLMRKRKPNARGEE